MDMEGEKNSLKYSSIVGKKLLLISIGIFILYLLILLLIDFLFSLLLGYKIYLTVCGALLAFLIAVTPYLSFIRFYARNKTDNNFVDKLAHCKYNPLFPFYFFVDAGQQKSNRIDFETIIPLVKDCDVVLRRYENYLDGLIFSQNSYFTHVGILYKDDQNNYQVYHAEGKHGVHTSSLEDFLVCDDVAFLRFSFNTNHDEIHIRQHIIDDNRSTTEVPNLSDRELGVFDNMSQMVASKTTNASSHSDQKFEEEYAGIILERAKSLLKTGYDFDFDFHNFEFLSCIEFVWYSFKCLFPVHQIKVMDFEYFGIFRLPVIIPDVFIKNKHFRFIYTSLPGIKTKNQLRRKIISGSRQLRLFLLVMLTWEIIIFCSIFFFIWFMIK